MDKKVHGCKQVPFTGFSKTFQFIHNNRRTKTREERFMGTLCN